MKRYKNFTLLIILSIIVLIGNYGCGKKVLKVTLFGGNELNRSNVVVVRIYQLRSDTRFQLAMVESFWKDKNADETLLGSDFINKQEIMLYPREQQMVQITIDPETKFLGVAANFFHPHKDKWHQLIPIRKYKKKVAIVLGEDSLIITDPRSIKQNDQ